MCNVQSATQDCKVFTKSETAPLETIPLTEDSMQTEVLKDATEPQFRNHNFLQFQRQGFNSCCLRINRTKRTNRINRTSYCIER